MFDKRLNEINDLLKEALLDHVRTLTGDENAELVGTSNPCYTTMWVSSKKGAFGYTQTVSEIQALRAAITELKAKNGS